MVCEQALGSRDSLCARACFEKAGDEQVRRLHAWRGRGSANAVEYRFHGCRALLGVEFGCGRTETGNLGVGLRPELGHQLGILW